MEKKCSNPTFVEDKYGQKIEIGDLVETVLDMAIPIYVIKSGSVEKLNMNIMIPSEDTIFIVKSLSVDLGQFNSTENILLVPEYCENTTSEFFVARPCYCELIKKKKVIDDIPASALQSCLTKWIKVVEMYDDLIDQIEGACSYCFNYNDFKHGQKNVPVCPLWKVCGACKGARFNQQEGDLLGKGYSQFALAELKTKEAKEIAMTMLKTIREDLEERE
jgi:hypothetical protein